MIEETRPLDITNIFREIQTVLFDLDGVLLKGNRVIDGAKELLNYLSYLDIRYGLVSNNSSLSTQQHYDRLQQVGLDFSYDTIFTAALATRFWLEAHVSKGSRINVLGTEALTETLCGDGYYQVSQDNADVVVVGLDQDFSYQRALPALRSLAAGARFIATNADATRPAAKDGEEPETGAIAAFLTTASGVRPYFVGKPEVTLFELALKGLGANAANSLFIGDRLDTDVLGAQRSGLISALVLTGVTSIKNCAESSIKPDVIFEDLQELQAAWRHKVS